MRLSSRGVAPGEHEQAHDCAGRAAHRALGALLAKRGRVGDRHPADRDDQIAQLDARPFGRAAGGQPGHQRAGRVVADGHTDPAVGQLTRRAGLFFGHFGATLKWVWSSPSRSIIACIS